jgi:hypothetical protein
VEVIRRRGFRAHPSAAPLKGIGFGVSRRKGGFVAFG